MYDYRVYLEADQSVRSMKLPLAAYGTESSAAMGAWVLLEPNKAEQTEGAGRTVSWDVQKKAGKDRQSIPAGFS